VIVVIGNPAWRAVEPAAPGGRACEIAMSAARRGARVELVGRTGDDAAGDALLLALSRAGVGHVAMLRDPARSTPLVEPVAEDGGRDDAGIESGVDPVLAARPVTPAAATAPRLESADVSLGLRYLAAFEVLVVVDDVPEDAVPVAVEAAGYADAHLVVLVGAAGPTPALLPASATVLAAPEADDGAFAELVGAYAAALDRGTAPEAAFAAATGDGGWEPLEPGA